MNNSNTSAKAQLVDKLNRVNNVLITVSSNPSIDQLTSALAIALMVNHLNKRGVAVFSGEMPQSLNFLQPEKTFESNADSLRDFIISISKEKAGRLRVNPDGDFVKVYITPYRSKITPADLTFEDGDFNVELIIALGVNSQDDLDQAIAAHGKIFHDAVTATINLNPVQDELGTISWQGNGETCYAQLTTDLIKAISNDAVPALLDSSIATTLLTGVVAATDQFRNSATTADVMSLASYLMDCGANQQLIAAEFSGYDIVPKAPDEENKDYDRVDLPEPAPEPEPEPEPEPAPEPAFIPTAAVPELSESVVVNGDDDVLKNLSSLEPADKVNLADHITPADEFDPNENPESRINRILNRERTRVAATTSNNALSEAQAQLKQVATERLASQAPAPKFEPDNPASLPPVPMPDVNAPEPIVAPASAASTAMPDFSTIAPDDTLTSLPPVPPAPQPAPTGSAFATMPVPDVTVTPDKRSEPFVNQDVPAFNINMPMPPEPPRPELGQSSNPNLMPPELATPDVPVINNTLSHGQPVVTPPEPTADPAQFVIPS